MNSLKHTLTSAIVCCITFGPIAEADPVTSLQSSYVAKGANVAFDSEAGKTLWRKEYATKAGQKRSCKSCHGESLTNSGKHAKTGKIIQPMAPSVNSNRLTDTKKIEKWFRRNCKWTMGRLCSPQEKGDLLNYLSTL